jgi:hypothetical protein
MVQSPMNDLIYALAFMAEAFKEKEWKTDRQFEAFSLACTTLAKYPKERDDAFTILDMVS